MVEPVDLGELADALHVTGGGEMIALVGGGGKTTSLFTLGEQLADTGTTIVTTTTRMGSEQRSGFPLLVDPSDDELHNELTSTGTALVWKATEGRRATGVGPADCDRWFGGIADNVIVEADGSRKRPFKAPAAYEPVVPVRTTLLVACIGVGALGRPIDECCHRPELVAVLASCAITDELTPARAASVLLSNAGSRKAKPDHARFAVAIHRVSPTHEAAARELASVLEGRADVIAVRQLTDRL